MKDAEIRASNMQQMTDNTKPQRNGNTNGKYHLLIIFVHTIARAILPLITLEYTQNGQNHSRAKPIEDCQQSRRVFNIAYQTKVVRSQCQRNVSRKVINLIDIMHMFLFISRQGRNNPFSVRLWPLDLWTGVPHSSCLCRHAKFSQRHFSSFSPEAVKHFQHNLRGALMRCAGVLHCRTGCLHRVFSHTQVFFFEMGQFGMGQFASLQPEKAVTSNQKTLNSWMYKHHNVRVGPVV